MARIKKACKNHPDRLSSRRCYYCHAYLCSECQHHFEHHIFCGRWCYLRWKITAFVKRLRKKTYVLPLTLLVLILFSNGTLLLYVNHRFNQLPTVKTEPAVVRKSDSVYFKLDSTFSPSRGQLSLQIHVSPNLSASLWHNGTLEQFTSEQNGKIIFKHVPLRFGNNQFIIWAHRANGQTQLIDSLHIYFSSARLQYLSQPVLQVRTNKKIIALTFDAGSTNRGSQNILTILRNHNLHCTLFVTGQFLKQHPELVQQMVIDGHEIGNHTFSHPHFTTYNQNSLQKTAPHVNRAFVRQQLLKVDSLFFQLTRKHLAPFWRAPFGEYNKDILRWAAEAGFKHIGWSSKCDALDWTVDSTNALYRSGNEILNHFLKLEKEEGLAGKIILMHLGTDRQADFPYQILPALIDSLQNRGYRFVTVSELLNQQGLL